MKDIVGDLGGWRMVFVSGQVQEAGESYVLKACYRSQSSALDGIVRKPHADVLLGHVDDVVWAVGDGRASGLSQELENIKLVAVCPRLRVCRYIDL